MNKQIVRFVGVGLLASSVVLSGCKSKSHAGEEAKKGAAYGALGGAVSGFFSAVVRGGDPLQRAAEGAVIGGATGATMGAVHGSVKDREIKAEYGETNYKALMALVNRNYPKAKELAAQTANHENPTYRKASLWISTLVARETLSDEEMKPYYDKVVELGDRVDSVEDAKVEVRLAERDLKKLRKQLKAN